MVFNPLFLQNENSNGISNTPKLTKLNNSTYLFSDIIRLLNSGSSENISIMPEESSQAGSGLLNSTTNSENAFGNQAPILDSQDKALLNSLGIQTTGGNDFSKETNNDSNPVPLTLSKTDLTSFLEKILSILALNDPNTQKAGNSTSSVVNQKSLNIKNGSQLGSDLINQLKDNNGLTINIDLLNIATLNSNDKQQLLNKLFNSGNSSDESSLNLNTDNKLLSDKQLEKVVSIILQLLNPQSTTSVSDGSELNSIDPSIINSQPDYNTPGIEQNIKEQVQQLFNSNQPLTINFKLGDKELGIKIVPAQQDITNNEKGTPNVAADLENNVAISSKVKVSDNSNKTTLQSNVLTSGDIISNSDGKFIVKITSEKSGAALSNDTKNSNTNISKLQNDLGVKTEVSKNGSVLQAMEDVTTKSKVDNTGNVVQDNNSLKEMLTKAGNNEEIELKVLNSENKTSIKTEASQAQRVIPNDKIVVTDSNNPDQSAIQTKQIAENQGVITVNDKLNSTGNAQPEIIETVNNATTNNTEPKENSKTNLSTGKTSIETVDEQQAIIKPDLNSNDAGQKSFSDKKESFDGKVTINQNNTLNARGLQNEATQNVLKSFIEENNFVKANDLINKVSQVFESGESKSIELKLQPESLGKVKIVLDVADKVVNANIHVDNEAVKQVIQNNINVLKQTLNLSGLQLSSFNVSLNYSENNGNKLFNQKKKSSQPGFKQKINDNQGDLVTTKKMGYNTYDFLI